MSSLGQLVAGIAHEINNPINFIYGNLPHASDYTRDLLNLVKLYDQTYANTDAAIQRYRRQIDLDFLVDDLPQMLESMQIGADRIREIVLSLRNFSRLDEAEMKRVDIHEGIDNTLLILQNRLKASPAHPGIEIVKEYGNLPLVECYVGQLNQVFMNILSNAIDALDIYNQRRSPAEIQANPLTITIHTEAISHQSSSHALPTPRTDAIQSPVDRLHVSSRPEAIRVSAPLPTPHSVLIRIRDNGPGIPSEYHSRLFDPFFTTKPVGKGTGLGLSISYQIVVERHRGVLKCLSVPGQGAEFWIEIPVRQNLAIRSTSA